MNEENRINSHFFKIAGEGNIEVMIERAAYNLCKQIGTDNSMIDHIKSILGIGYQYGMLHAADIALDCADAFLKSSGSDDAFTVSINIKDKAGSYKDWLVTILPE